MPSVGPFARLTAAIGTGGTVLLQCNRGCPTMPSSAASLPPPDNRYFEDYPEGGVFEFGERTVTEADILDFAHRFDPQDMHTDPDAAANGAFGGLIASGWHTGSLMMRMLADHYLPKGGLASRKHTG